MTDRRHEPEYLQEPGQPGPRPAGSAAPTITWDPRIGGWLEPDRAPPDTSSRQRPATQRRGILLAAVVGGVIGALLTAAVVVPFTRGETVQQVIERRLDDGITTTGPAGDSIVEIAARATPWVVNINVTARRSGPFGNVPLQATGTGVILRSDGHIITNAHVVQGAEEVEVTLASGEKLAAEMVGADVDTDVAVIRVDRNDLPAAVIGSAKDLRVGEVAVAIGSPLGLEQSVTAGIVSALGRTVDRPGAPPLVDMIQTDAAVTQGNSGGALVNGAGAVVGINTAVAVSPELGAEGIAFAIPIEVVVVVARQLIEVGRATHPWLGITGANITPEVAAEFGVPEGARIIEVLPGSPADRAGLRPDDVIVSFDGEPIEGMDELVVAIRERGVGATVEMVAFRDGSRATFQVTLGEKPDSL